MPLLIRGERSPHLLQLITVIAFSIHAPLEGNSWVIFRHGIGLLARNAMTKLLDMKVWNSIGARGPG
jgi:hypothetical protein